jgi:hypothetical protein
MKKKYSLLLGLIIISLFSASSFGLSAPTRQEQDKPIVVIIADKMDSMELFNTELPGIHKFLKSAECGLMNIRSSKGYTDSGSAYLSLGAGNRGNATGQPNDSFNLEQFMTNNPSASFSHWTMGIPLKVGPGQRMFVPDIGWLSNLARQEDHQVSPGRLGALFHQEGWRTCLIGNIDSADQENRPGSLFLMDSNGMIDEGTVEPFMNETDSRFPYLYRANVNQMISELQLHLAGKKIIALEFGDFARLDNYKEQMSPALYESVKRQTWQRLNSLIEQVLRLGTPTMFTTILFSPSISKEGTVTKNLLAPIVIYRQDSPPGILGSGTTRWSGLVANVDLLPTLANIAHFKKTPSLTGKVMVCQPTADGTKKLATLNQRLVALSANQRPIINWYQGIISCCWIAGLLSGIFLKRRWIRDWFISLVIVIPLTVIVLPLFPIFTWQISGFLVLTIILAAIFTRIKDLNIRILVLSALIWLILVFDQMTGWRLIRFSALGYSAIAGSRYYGLGNEFLGIFLAAALLFTDLLNRKTKSRWSTPLILGMTIFILSWPQFGAKFGGILAGTVGFAYYLVKIYHWEWKNRKFWFIFIGCSLVLFAISWWDSLRPPDAQTHIGRFLHLILSKDFGQVSQIILRKIAMNLKLTLSSPWIRIILLAFVLKVVQRWLTGRKIILQEDTLVWKAILVAGICSYLVNDAGVLAFATCLAYGFSYILLKFDNQVEVYQIRGRIHKKFRT